MLFLFLLLLTLLRSLLRCDHLIFFCVLTVFTFLCFDHLLTFWRFEIFGRLEIRDLRDLEDQGDLEELEGLRDLEDLRDLGDLGDLDDLGASLYLVHWNLWDISDIWEI